MSTRQNQQGLGPSVRSPSSAQGKAAPLRCHGMGGLPQTRSQQLPPPSAGEGGPAGVAAAATACLESDPHLPFHQRLNARHVKAGRLGDVVILVRARLFFCFHVRLQERPLDPSPRPPCRPSPAAQVLCIAGLLKCGHMFLGMRGWQRTAVFAWQGAAFAGSAAGILWRHRWPRSFVRHRELPAALMRLVCMGCGLGGLIMTRVLDESPLPADGGTAGGLGQLLTGPAHFLLLIFASGTLHMLLFFCTWRVRLRWAGRMPCRVAFRRKWGAFF